MEKETIIKLNKSFEESAYEQDGVEYWLDRELQGLLGYSDWRNFLNAVEKAKESCKTTGEAVLDHFVDITKMVKIGSGAERKQDDIMLTRYLIAQNGDPKKEQIAANIRSKGDWALFGGLTTSNMKRKLGIPENRPLADFLPTITITAKQLATEITNFNVKQHDLKGEARITDEHVKNNKDVRGLLGKSGIKPEQLTAEEDIKKLERRVKSADKGIEKKKHKGKKY